MNKKDTEKEEVKKITILDFIIPQLKL